jgi:periplasmic copper chaperone A
MKRIALMAALLLTLTAAGAMAQSSGGIAVESIWARATPPGAKTGAVYLTLANKGFADDKLVGASTPVAAMAGLHTELMANGVMEMRPLKSIDVPPGGTAVLKPGGRHIMLMGLKQPLKRGGHFRLTLEFAHAAPLTVQVEVAKVGAAGPAMDDMKGMDH